MKYILFIIAMAAFTSGCFQISEGETTGIITKLSKTGFICKTNEGRMSVGFTKDGVGTVSHEEMHFTVENDGVLAHVKQAMETGRPVKLHYSSEIFTICRSESNKFVTAVENVQ